MAVVSVEKVLGMVSDLRRDMQVQIDELKSELATVRARQEGSSATASAAQEVSPDELVMIAAAVTAYLGVKVRIRSAKVVQSSFAPINPWAQHGRALIHAMHDLRHGRGR
ncbi:MAG: hypothetical protein HQL37_11185 [Alphaproteobacteria bacterium]|nr:hypothetical protein [Alphaproteobacteria bacterium]